MGIAVLARNLGERELLPTSLPVAQPEIHAQVGAVSTATLNFNAPAGVALNGNSAATREAVERQHILDVLAQTR
jgi:hypothetical protein